MKSEKIKRCFRYYVERSVFIQILTHHKEQDENIFETQNNFFPDADATLKACDQKI